MSFEALGLLAYCLSMPEDWEFHPKVIWKQRDCSRDKVYRRFNELIEKFHCIRIQLPNPKARHLPGEVEYEFYDDTEECKKRIKQLEQSENFITHGSNLKKCLRHPEYQDPKGWDPNSQEETNTNNKTKETNNTKETTTTPTPSNSKPQEKEVVVEKIKALKNYLDKFSNDYGEKFKIPIDILEKLSREFGQSFLIDQVNAMVKQEQQAEKDENLPHKKIKASRIEKPLSYLKLSCQNNWAMSEHKL